MNTIDTIVEELAIQVEVDGQAVVVVPVVAIGPAGTDGIGVPAGGTTGQVLAKTTVADYDTSWVDQTGGGGGSLPDPVTVAHGGTGANNATTARTNLGLGSSATHPATDFDAAGAAAAAQAASQPLDSDLTAVAALTTQTYGRSLLTTVDAPGARSTLGLGTAATKTAMLTNVADYGANGSSVTVYTAVSTSVAADTFTRTAHGFVNGDSVELSAIVATTGVSAGPTYYVVGATANTFQVAITPGGAAINLTGADGTATVTGIAAAALTANNTAFTNAWAAARAAQGMLYIPPGNYAIGPGILATTTDDAGITGDDLGTTFLWLVDTTNTGTCISQSVTDTAYWSKVSRIACPSIKGVTIDGTFAGTGSVGLRVGPAHSTFWEVRVQNFSGTGGANGVTGMTGAIGILMQNNPAAASTQFTESNTFGSRTSVQVCTNALVIDTNGGHASFGYNQLQFFHFRNCNSGVTIANGAWLYAGTFVFEGVTTLGITTSGIVLSGSSRLTGQLKFNYEVNNNSATVTTISVGSGSIWKTIGYIDVLTASFAMSSTAIVGVFQHEGPLYVSAQPSSDGWCAHGNFEGPSSSPVTRTAGATNVASTFTVYGDSTARYKRGVRVRWAESGTLKYGVVAADSTYAPNVTTVTLAANLDYWMAANPDTGSLMYSDATPPDYPIWFGYQPGFTGYATTPALAGSMPFTGVTTDVTANTFTRSGHGLVNGDCIYFTAIVNTTGINAGTSTTNIYYVVGVAGTAFQCAITPGGAAVDLTGTNGTVTVNAAVGPPTTLIYRFRVEGRACTVIVREGTQGVSNATTLTFNVPITPATVTNEQWVGSCAPTDNGVIGTVPGVIVISSGNVNAAVYKDWSQAAFTNTGGKRIRYGQIIYEI
jgi:hypothetical protein